MNSQPHILRFRVGESMDVRVVPVSLFFRPEIAERFPPKALIVGIRHYIDEDTWTWLQGVANYMVFDSNDSNDPRWQGYTYLYVKDAELNFVSWYINHMIDSSAG